MILLLLGTLLILTATAAQTVLKSSQLAASPTNTYVLQTNGTVNAWVDPTTIPGGDTDLDDAYNNSPSSAKTITADDGQVEILGAFIVNAGGAPAAVPAGFSVASTVHGEHAVTSAAGFIAGVDTGGAAVADGWYRMEDADGTGYWEWGVGNRGADTAFKLPDAEPTAYAGRLLAGVPAVGASTMTWGGDRDSYFGVYDAHVGAGSAYMFFGYGAAGPVQYAGTGAADSLGVTFPWACTIVGIGASTTSFVDPDGVSTVDIWPYADGAVINAACKATLPEGAGAEITATFTPGTYNVTAGQRLGIYFTQSDAGFAPGTLANLCVTIWYQFP